MRPELRLLCLVLVLSIALVNSAWAQTPDPAMSSATVTPGIIRANWDDAPATLSETLAEQGHVITVTIRDAAGIPVAGVDPSRITLGPYGDSTLEFCEPLYADGSTDGGGVTTISGYFHAGGNASDGYDGLAVLLDGVPLGGGSLPLEMSTADMISPGRVDLSDLDVAWFAKSYLHQFGPPTYTTPDLNRDGTISDDDLILLANAFSSSCSPLYVPPVLQVRHSFGIYFDAAGTQTTATAAVGDVIDLYLIADLAPKLPSNNPHPQVYEFSIPALGTADLDLISFEFESAPGSTPPVLARSDGESWFIGAHSNTDTDRRLPVAHIRCRVQSPVTGLLLHFGGLPPSISSTAPTPRPVYTTNLGSDLYEFAGLTGAILNPVTGIVFDGLEHEARGAGSLTDLGDRIRLSIAGLDLGEMEAFMASGSGEGSDGLRVSFLTDLPAVNLDPQAYLRQSVIGPENLPGWILTGTLTLDEWLIHPDMSDINSPNLGPDLVLRNGGQVIEQIQNYVGGWTIPEALPDVQETIVENGELVLRQLWPQGIQITLENQVTYPVDEIEIRSNSGGSIDPGWLRSIFVEASQIPDIDIGGQSVLTQGTWMSEAEGMLFWNDPGRFVMLPFDVEDPASVVMTSADGEPMLVQGYPPPWPPIAAPELEVRFEDSVDPTDPAVPLLLSGPDGQVDITLDLQEQMTDSYDVYALLGGQVVGQSSRSAPFFGTAPAWPTSWSLDGNAVVLRWPQPVSMDIGSVTASARAVQIQFDELRLEAVQPGAMPDGGRVRLSMLGTERMQFTGDLLPTSAPAPTAHRSILHPNVPNPFNPSTEIRFEIARSGPMRLAIYDLKGRHVATLADEWREAGPAELPWDGRDEEGRMVASGVYHAVLEAGGERHARKITLLK